MNNMLTWPQIRIITDTHAHERPNKKKKPHRGYAFVVFDREKDMRGNSAIAIFILDRPHRSKQGHYYMSLTRDLALRLAYLSLPLPFSPCCVNAKV